MTDDELQEAMAGALGWMGLHRCPDGQLYGVPRGMLVTVPWEVPDWPRDPVAAEQLCLLIERRFPVKVPRELTLSNLCKAVLAMLEA